MSECPSASCSRPWANVQLHEIQVVCSSLTSSGGEEELVEQRRHPCDPVANGGLLRPCGLTSAGGVRGYGSASVCASKIVASSRSGRREKDSTASCRARTVPAAVAA